MGRPDVARRRSRGGDGIQALRGAHLRLTRGFPSVAALAVVAAYPPAVGARFAEAIAILSATAVIALVAGLAAGWAPLVAAALALAGGSYAVLLVAEGGGIDFAAALVAGGLLLAAELAYGALEANVTPLWSMGVAVAAAVAAALVLSAAGTEVVGGLALELVGIGGAVAVLALLAVLARRYG